MEKITRIKLHCKLFRQAMELSYSSKKWKYNTILFICGSLKKKKITKIRRETI